MPSEIKISLNRPLTPMDEKAVDHLFGQWLVYDAKINRRRLSAEIELFHTEGAKPDLVNNGTFPQPKDN